MNGDDAAEARYGPVPPAVLAVYGPDDLSSVPVFRGGFINFGLWDGIPLDGPLTVEDRERSERQLYRRVLDALGGGDGLRALEVGCGLGVGCALALEEYAYASVTGMDVHPDQLDRARRANAALLAEAPGRLRLVRGAAELMPSGDGEFDHVYSVEAAQHFRDLDAFARECARTLRPGGRVAVASFFVPGEEDRPDAARELAERLDSFASGLDAARPLGALTGALAEAGLADVRAESIGASVWPGLDRYLEGLDLQVSWPRNFLRSYRDGILDYYLVTAARRADGP
ncbi:methyltransferase domain-containing protein [Streptomyces somaliensis DSM 40738]|uniref:Methyltransferase domain-containing protein n=1 Tax=Streptomyces somaliensis (strain ATCC 33201 / DSM 40738 / JCM 12659 / KCTC 9044 / NCTC 11332 / NRRL B-12077 / IP 733) TaxID=1134445 RepID=A0AA44DBR2_STRE0|nr:methyltransferase domain-containing protein [Streptomyces somaliensis]MCQ0025357.1 methyltransferase domain-containing protein [Streptomyces somaliensis DSM 40738]NKY13559.1 methyltransferase domain-containing protein [Streptomyces somaliensis DSM 40738]